MPCEGWAITTCLNCIETQEAFEIDFNVISTKILILRNNNHAVAKFLVPDWGDIVDSGIGLSYRHD
jgi:hypothetical protein